VVVVPEARCDDDEDGTPVFSCVAAMGRRFFFSFFTTMAVHCYGKACKYYIILRRSLFINAYVKKNHDTGGRHDERN
jgi:hypothetical protein